MYILLARHGNTFEDGQVPVWIGAKEDLPLTAVGREQAQAIASALVEHSLYPHTIFAGPLARTLEASKIIASSLGKTEQEIIVSSALKEIDYGKWGGRSSDELVAQYGQKVVAQWERGANFPQPVAFGEDEQVHLKSWEVFLEKVRQKLSHRGVALAITSNGKLRLLLRYVLSLNSLEEYPGHGKVRTGNLCALDLRQQKILFWNQPPADGIRQFVLQRD